MRRAVLLVAIFLVTLVSPVLSTAQANTGGDTLVCCDASTVDLYLIGGDNNKRLTPFAADLGEDPQSFTAETSINSQESIGRWLLPNTWGGTVEFNMDVFHELRGLQRRCSNPKRNSHREHRFQTFSQELDQGSSFLAQGAGSLTFDIDVETLTASGSSNIELNSPFRPLCSAFRQPTQNWNSSGGARTRIRPLKPRFPLWTS